MRTTAAAASVVTSAPPLLPQPDLIDSVETKSDKDVMNEKKTHDLNMKTEIKETAAGNSVLNSEHSTVSAKNESSAMTEFITNSISPSVLIQTATEAAQAGVAGAFGNPASTTAGNVTSMFQAAGFASSSQPFDIAASTRRLAKELEEFVEKGLEGVLAAERGDPGAPSEETIAELQLQTARMLRQLLPTNRDLLHLVQERNWIPLLLGWLNLHDRPAVQVEALLALTNIAELCAQQSYYLHTSATAAAAASAAAAAAAAAANGIDMTGNGVGSNIETFSSSMEGLDPAALAQNPYLFPSFPSNYYVPQQGSNSNNGAISQSPLSVANFSNLMNSVLTPSQAMSTSENNVFSNLSTSNPNDSVSSKDNNLNIKKQDLATNEKTDAKRKYQASGTNFVESNNDHINDKNTIKSGSEAKISPTTLSSQSLSSPVDTGKINGVDATHAVSSAHSFEWDSRNAALSQSSSFQNSSDTSTTTTLFPPSQTSFPLSLPPLMVPSDANSSSQASPSSSTIFNTNAAMSSSTRTPANNSIPLSNSNPSLFLPPVSQNSTSFVGGIPQPLSTSSQHLLLRHADAIPTLISLLSSPNKEVHEQAMWILGSIAAGESTSTSTTVQTTGTSGSNSNSNDSVVNNINERGSNVSARDVLLAAGVMSPLLQCLDSSPKNLSLQRIGSWALSNLVEGRVQHQNKLGSSKDASNKLGPINCNNNHSGNEEIKIQSLLPTLRRLLYLADAEVLGYTCWTLSHLCDGPSSHIAAVVTSSDLDQAPGGLVPRLVELLVHQSWRVTKPALRTIGNIVCAECGEDGTNNGVNGDNSEISESPAPPTDYTEVILDCGAVPRLKQLISHGNREIQKEACWTLSNIAAGTVDQIQAVINSGAIAPLVSLVNDSKTDQEVRSEACWVVLNATSCGSDQQIEVLVDEGCVSVLGVLLGEPSMVMMALEGLERVLQVEENREISRRHKTCKVVNSKDDNANEKNDVCSTIVSASLIERALEKHNSPAVSKRAGRIWKMHFVSCALCRKSFSKHRPADARFCGECKCYVCSNCNCEVYHLSYQEELWAATEEKNESSKKAKKNKKQKKKEKRKEKEKEKKARRQAAILKQPENSTPNVQKQHHLRDGDAERSRSSTVTSSSDIPSSGVPQISTSNSVPFNRNKPPVNDIVTSSNKISNKSLVDSEDIISESATNNVGANLIPGKAENLVKMTNSGPSQAKRTVPKISNKKSEDKEKVIVPSNLMSDDDLDDENLNVVNETNDNFDVNNDQPPIDFVHYLQQTGSIIALAKLMDALEYGDAGDNTYSKDSTLLHSTDEKDRRILGSQAAT